MRFYGVSRVGDSEAFYEFSFVIVKEVLGKVYISSVLSSKVDGISHKGSRTSFEAVSLLPAIKLALEKSEVRIPLVSRLEIEYDVIKQVSGLSDLNKGGRVS